VWLSIWFRRCWVFLFLGLSSVHCATGVYVQPPERHVFGGASESFSVVVRRNGRRAEGEPIQAAVSSLPGHPADCAAISGAVTPTNPEGATSVGVKGKPDAERDCVADLEVSAPGLPASETVLVFVHPRRVTEQFAGDPRHGTVTVWPRMAVQGLWKWLLTTNNDARVRRVVVRTPEDITSCSVFETERSPLQLSAVITRPDSKSFEVNLPAAASPQDGWNRLEVELICVAEPAYPSKLETTFRITPVAGQDVHILLLPGPKRP
jgi:hypothetical protein